MLTQGCASPQLPCTQSAGEPDFGVHYTRHGYKVWYYHGRGAYRIRAQEAHDIFEDYLNEIQLAPEVVALYRAMATELRADEATRRARQRRQAQEEIERLEGRLLQVDERYLDGDLEKDSYRRLKEKYSHTLAAARHRLLVLDEQRTLVDQVTFAVGVLGRMGRLWREADVDVRSQLVGSTWPSGIEIVGGKCRTPVESELIALFRGETQKTREGSTLLDAAFSSGGDAGSTSTLSAPYQYSIKTAVETS